MAVTVYCMGDLNKSCYSSVFAALEVNILMYKQKQIKGETSQSIYLHEFAWFMCMCVNNGICLGLRSGTCTQPHVHTHVHKVCNIFNKGQLAEYLIKRSVTSHSSNSAKQT